MNFRKATSFIVAAIAMAAHGAMAAIGDDYIDAVPATVYEAADLSPQNMDYDKANKKFIAHGGWYNNRLVHYYKFRIFAPGTYPDLIKGPPNMSPASDVPIQKVMMTTTTGDFTGVVGKPILEFHTSDGNSYSDFMNVKFVMVDATYVADTFKSAGDVTKSGNTLKETDIIMNFPVVPTGSSLQSPVDKTATAPIKPITAFYKGQEVQTFIFEVNNQAAFDYFNPKTRDQPNDADYAIPVVTTFASKTAVTSIPLWHVNQFTRGVSAVKGNQGGPSDAGMRNLINLDRPDAGYSPLWQLFWVTELPIDYMADQISINTELTAANGAAFIPTPMYVNCPDVGPVGTTDNADRQETHQLKLDLAQESNFVLGSHADLLLKEGLDVKITTEDGTKVAEGKTNIMGAYEIEVKSSDIPDGTTKLKVMYGTKDIRTLEVEDTSSDASSMSVGMGMATAMLAATLM